MEQTGKIQNWKQLFTQSALSGGKDYNRRGRVADLEKNKDDYTGAVVAEKRYEVRIHQSRDGSLAMHCTCPQARGGNNCKHMAAVCFAIEKMQKTEEEKKEDKKEERKEEKEKRTKESGVEDESRKQPALISETREDDGQMIVLNPDMFAPVKEEKAELAERRRRSYSYFNTELLRSSMDFKPEIRRKGEGRRRKKEISLDDIHFGYTDFEEKLLGEAIGTGIYKNQRFPVQIVFSKDQILRTECHCPDCRKYFYGWYDRRKYCSWMSGFFDLLETYLNTYCPGDATNRTGQGVLLSFQEKRVNRMTAEVTATEESLTLQPRLIKKGGKLSLSFRIGIRKLFVIKNLEEFCENVKRSATQIYGSETQINHRLSNFTEQGKRWIRFISQITQEEAEFERRLRESESWSRKAVGKNGALALYGWRLDRFYEMIEQTGVEYEDKDASRKVKGLLTCKDGNPEIVMRIQKKEEKNIFQGVLIYWDGPELFEGTRTSYFIEENSLKMHRIDPAFLEKTEPIYEFADEGKISFLIGRNKLSEFYYTVLPQLRDIVRVEEKDAAQIERYLPPEVRFVFYLDAWQGNITCTAHARYGESEVSMLDLYLDREKVINDTEREENREAEMMYRLRQWFPYVNEGSEEFHCGGEEERVCQFLENGLEALMTMGEVQCTRRFQNLNRARKVKISVGVSVSQGLLDLDISADEMSRQELLEALESYRVKKKFHRLKNGDFINLDDEGLFFLEEMMESLRLSPKEFVEGKMHLPLYRTLYLEKMLEEQEGVYSTRDSRFREMVKDFKTVNEADFEVPVAISKVMRKYQVTGYKWLRTLETRNFGGILADDMGLGKTLQTIAVLLSARLEGRAGRTLIVAPASLVFNWGEEIRRFAPQLEFCLVTGTQEERRMKIESWESFDVLITSYDLLKRDISCYEGKQFDYQVIDEAQYIKNHTTAAAKAVKLIRSRTRFALTGTPIENRLSELWSIFDYLMPGYLYSYEVFKREFESPIVKNQDQAASERLQKMVSPFILRRIKQNVLKDLPDKLEEIRYVRLEGEQQKLYNAQVQFMRQKIASQDPEEFRKNHIQTLAELTKLRQICCDPALCYEDYGGESAKRESCLELIESAVEGGHRLLVFSQFTSMLDLLKPELDKRNISYFEITGETRKETRLQLVKDFNEGDVKVFLISLRAGGVGLNLTGADVVIHYDPWWNLAVQNQATDRAHRIGQTRKVTVYQLIVKHTVEEKIRKLQETKKDLSDQILQGKGGQLAGMTKEEFLQLLEG